MSTKLCKFSNIFVGMHHEPDLMSIRGHDAMAGVDTVNALAKFGVFSSIAVESFPLEHRWNKEIETYD